MRAVFWDSGRGVANPVAVIHSLEFARPVIDIFEPCLSNGSPHPGTFGPPTALQILGRKLAERGGKNGRKRAVVAVARKLAVLLHRLWVTQAPYEPMRGARVEAAQLGSADHNSHLVNAVTW